ncbi:MAG TPA: alpha-ketoglutarate-dependent dioxygenase AlkB [Casimicrobiaceae bacterium]|nr:alpha-ketoglutarate-dependent dioxygenase AlkB [Casimicrobiaceae bacterium]
MALAFGASLPGGLVYQPGFLTSEEEAELLEAIGGLTLHEATYKSYSAKRRTASFGSSYDFDRNELEPAPPLPQFLYPLRHKVAAWLGMRSDAFVHGLVTEYRAGTSLGWHRDVHQFGVVVGVSLAAPCRMRFRPYPPRGGRDPNTFALELQPRSAYVLQGNIRWRWQHSIAPTKALRYSITLRTAAGDRRAGAPES